MTLAIPAHVARMRNVTMEFVHVCPNSKAIHTEAVGPNVSLIQIARETRLASEINASTPVLESAVKMRFVLL